MATNQHTPNTEDLETQFSIDQLVPPEIDLPTGIIDPDLEPIRLAEREPSTTQSEEDDRYDEEIGPLITIRGWSRSDFSSSQEPENAVAVPENFVLI